MTQRNWNYRLKAQRESHCFSPGKEVAERGRSEGFTLIELMTVLAVIGVITIVALTSLRGGLFSEYAASQTLRKVVVAVQEARMRAFQNEQVTKVNNVSALPNDTYQVNFVVDSSGKCNHGFQDGDYAAFTGLTYPAGMNGGAYLVTTSGSTYIKLSFVGETTSNVTTETPLAKNITAASELVIRPRASKEDVAQRGELVYDASRVVVWVDGSWTPTPGNLPDDFPTPGGSKPIVTPKTLPGAQTIRFTSRGFTPPPNTSGYRILVAQRKPDGNLYYTNASGSPVPTSVLWVTVSPFGMVKTGRTDYANP